ncbi:MAG: hypothetical protein FRX48_06456 [Lasallia pustulata]|uniref:Uncharacterized protein n=1 Tax=Lasallia pustulata TaxID=136370 RepID=A0A5M8PMY4_9LECA|nr:MAG: hypothetical protein FRX48_06456 [Lasallia pustulata]
MHFSTTAIVLFVAQLAAAAPTPTTSTATACANFTLQLTNSDLILAGSPLNGTYAKLDPPSGSDTSNSAIEYEIGFNGASLFAATTFSLSADGNLYTQYAGLIASTDPGTQFGLFHFDRFPSAYTQQVPAVCAVADNGTLGCETLAGVNIFQLCPGAAAPNDLFLGSEVQSGCEAVTLEAVCV